MTFKDSKTAIQILKHGAGSNIEPSDPELLYMTFV